MNDVVPSSVAFLTLPTDEPEVRTPNYPVLCVGNGCRTAQQPDVNECMAVPTLLCQRAVVVGCRSSGEKALMAVAMGEWSCWPFQDSGAKTLTKTKPFVLSSLSSSSSSSSARPLSSECAVKKQSQSCVDEGMTGG